MTPDLAMVLEARRQNTTVRRPVGVDRDATAARLKAAGVPRAVDDAKPLHLQTAYRGDPVAANGVPLSERLDGEVPRLRCTPISTEQSRTASLPGWGRSADDGRGD